MKTIFATALFGLALATTAAVSQPALAGDTVVNDSVRTGGLVHPLGIFGAN